MTKTYSLKLDEQQVNIIGAGLGELPFKISSSVINELNKQLMEQQNDGQTNTGE